MQRKCLQRTLYVSDVCNVPRQRHDTVLYSIVDACRKDSRESSRDNRMQLHGSNWRRLLRRHSINLHFHREAGASPVRFPREHTTRCRIGPARFPWTCGYRSHWPRVRPSLASSPWRKALSALSLFLSLFFLISHLLFLRSPPSCDLFLISSDSMRTDPLLWRSCAKTLITPLETL